MMYLVEQKALSQFGFNPHEIVSSRLDFQKQLESYALHVIEDLPVSNKYSYLYDRERQKLFTENGTEVFIDYEERDGLSVIGTIKAVELSLDNKENLVFLYSPPGPVAFRPRTKYDQVKPYQTGQLYILKARDSLSNIVDCIALSVGKEYEEEVLNVFFGVERPRFDDEIQKISYYLTNPSLSSLTIKQLISLLRSFGERLFYKNAGGELFNFVDVANLLTQGYEGNIRPRVVIDYDELYKQALTDPKIAYLQQLYLYLNHQNRIVLGGGCGGAEVNRADIESILGNLNPLSTIWRTSDIFGLNNEKSDKYGSLEFECPHCHQKVQRPKNTLIEKCPKCGGDVKCK